MKTDPSGSTVPDAPLRRSMHLITLAGCLAMVFFTGTTNPAFIEFMRALGANDFHFGLLGGIPMIMLALQFFGAAITNVVTHRKVLFMVLVITGRFLYAPMALLPACLPGWRGTGPVVYVLVLLAAASGLMNISGPLWLSWMADLIPSRILNTYWGRRQRWMYATWTVSYLAVAAFVSFLDLPITTAFPVLAVIAVAAGITDILLFIHVHEPANMTFRGQRIIDTILAPIRSAEYRPFVIFSCAWSAAALFAASFMQVYVLKVLKLTVWQTTLIWCVSGVGIALVSSQWGKLADRHGHRPILAICIGFKSLVVIVFTLLTPASALWLLPITLFIDSFWNAGIMVASNGYMLKIAPQENRSMFIATLAGMAGIGGGLGAVAGGWFLDLTADFHGIMAGRTWNNYQLLFAVSIPLRLACIALAFRVHEPKASPPEQLLLMVRGTWPMRFLLFPVGLYRRRSFTFSPYFWRGA